MKSDIFEIGQYVSTPDNEIGVIASFSSDTHALIRFPVTVERIALSLLTPVPTKILNEVKTNLNLWNNEFQIKD